jgi:hypothetical protein
MGDLSPISRTGLCHNHLPQATGRYETLKHYKNPNKQFLLAARAGAGRVNGAVC